MPKAFLPARLALSVAVPVFLVTCPGDLEAPIEAFVTDYNHLRYHESIANLTPADVYFWRGQTILIERERIKRQTIANRRLAAPSASRITLQTRRARDSLKLSRSLSQNSDDGQGRIKRASVKME
jgi:hypothetical protein